MSGQKSASESDLDDDVSDEETDMDDDGDMDDGGGVSGVVKLSSS